MFRLRLLGGASLERHDGHPVAGRAVHRHRLALLSLLALAPAPRLSRDKLIATLWPERDTERGRNLLNVAVYELRKALGESALLSSGDDLRLNPAVVGSDAAELDAAAARGDHAGVVACYAGPLLDGFFLDDAPAFAEWVERERWRLSGVYAASLEALAAAAEARRDFLQASTWWRRRADQDPYDSRVALRLMQALDASGNRAHALQHADVHGRLLAAELGMPATEVVALAARLRIAPPPLPPFDAGCPPEPTPSTEPAPAPIGRPAAATPQSVRSDAGPRRARPSRWSAAALLAVGLVAAGMLWAFRPAAAGRARSVAVLPFTNMSADVGNDYFSDGITEEIIAQLSAVPSLKVISRTSVMHYKGTRKTLREIARELGVEHVLEGSVRREGGRVRVTAQLIDAADDRHLWAERYDRDVGDVFAVQTEIAGEVGRALAGRLGTRGGGAARRGTRDPQAYELYLLGRYHWEQRTEEGHRQAITYLQGAIARDSGYADAYAGLANAYLTAYQLNRFGFREREAEVFSRLRWAAERAVALDDHSAAAHTSLAIVRWWQRDWPGAERELRRAIDLNPGYSTAHLWYSALLTGLGRPKDAVREGRLAYELDPFAVVVSSSYASSLSKARQDDAAAEQARRAVALQPTLGIANQTLGLVYARSGRPEDAVRALRRAVELDPQMRELRPDLAYALALAGRRDEARAVLREVKTRPERPQAIGEAFGIGRAHMALGEADSAFAWFDRTDWRWPPRGSLNDPTLDPLRSDPRFVRLSARVAREMGVR